METRFFHRIHIHNSSNPWADRVLWRSWEGLRFDQMQRWSWFFRYMAALAQIQHPRMCVDHSWGSVKVSTHEAQIHLAALSVAARRGMLTKHLDKVEAFKRKHSTLFPYDQHELWPQVLLKECRLRQELAEAEERLKQLQASPPPTLSPL